MLKMTQQSKVLTAFTIIGAKTIFLHLLSFVPDKFLVSNFLFLAVS